MSVDEILQRCVQLGVSSVELRAQVIEQFMGPPPVNLNGPTASDVNGAYYPTLTPAEAARQAASADSTATGGRQTGRGGFGQQLTPEQRGQLNRWRLSAPFSKAKELRKKYDDAGVAIDIVKFDGIYDEPDEIVDYMFEVAKSLSARAISCEFSLPGSKRVGQIADKHKIPVGLHNHLLVTPAVWAQAFSYAKYNFANLDIGHYVAGNNPPVIDLIKQYHDRITHLHVKDRKLNGGPNVEFGMGDTPVKGILRLMRDNKWSFPATIEFEIPGPVGPNGQSRAWTDEERMSEIAKCLSYCRDALLT
jgi:sugar phosphate isomerase/epimerase